MPGEKENGKNGVDAGSKGAGDGERAAAPGGSEEPRGGGEALAAHFEEREATIQQKVAAAMPNARRIILSGLVVIGVFFGGMGVWAAFFPFSGAVIAPGTIKVSMNNRVVQHLEGGMVDEVLVKEGDHVAEGDLLVRLKSEQVEASVDMLQDRLWALLAQRARLEAQAHMRESIEWPKELLAKKDDPKVAAIMASEEEVFRSSLDDLEGKISLLEAQIAQLHRSIEGARAELQAKRAVIASVKEELKAKEALYKEKYLDKVQILELRRKLAEYKGDMGRITHQIAEMEKKIDEIRLQIIDLRNRYRESAFEKLNGVLKDIVDIRQRLRPLLDAKKRLEIRAPISGKVFNIMVNTDDGSVLRPGQPVLEIVPDGASLIAEAYVRPNDIAHVYLGQQVRVQLVAFNRRTVPPVQGKVVYISPDLIHPKDTGGGGLSPGFYKIHIKIDEDEVNRYDAFLMPGMPVVCYIMTEQRTILTYLLEPLLEMVDSSLREPD